MQVETALEQARRRGDSEKEACGAVRGKNKWMCGELCGHCKMGVAAHVPPFKVWMF